MVPCGRGFALFRFAFLSSRLERCSCIVLIFQSLLCLVFQSGIAFFAYFVRWRLILCLFFKAIISCALVWPFLIKPVIHSWTVHIRFGKINLFSERVFQQFLFWSCAFSSHNFYFSFISGTLHFQLCRISLRLFWGSTFFLRIKFSSRISRFLFLISAVFESLPELLCFLVTHQRRERWKNPFMMETVLFDLVSNIPPIKHIFQSGFLVLFLRLK